MGAVIATLTGADRYRRAGGADESGSPSKQAIWTCSVCRLASARLPAAPDKVRDEMREK